MTTHSIDDATIRETAYLLWLDEGQPEGRDQDHWRKAIEVLKTSHPKPKRAIKAAAKPRGKTAKAAPKARAKSKKSAQTK